VLKRESALLSRFNGWVSAVAIAMVLSAILVNIEFHYFENKLYDLRRAHDFELPADPRIVLINLDKETIKQLHEPYPLSLEAHSRLLQKILSFHPQGVGYLVDLKFAPQAKRESEKIRVKKQIIKISQVFQKMGVPLILGASESLGELPGPFLNTIPYAFTSVRYDQKTHPGDRVNREAPISIEGRLSFHARLASLLSSTESILTPPGTNPLDIYGDSSFYFRNHNKPKNTYASFSYGDVLNDLTPPSSFQNKVILIGSSTENGPSELIIHANILDSVLNHQGIEKASLWLNGSITLIAIAIVLGGIMTFTPIFGVFASLATSLGVVVICQLAFQTYGIWIRESLPLIGIFISYYLAVPYRLIREYKTRWELQRKNELLTQVEEMKTHFISLVTHDLKTPIARIQGLAEITLRIAREHQNIKELHTLDQLLTATEELDHFINRVLELNKVESNHLQLRLECKDVNQIIERIIGRFSDPARAKGVSILTQLEPLFPIRIDPELIYKVLSNILDNALKYSPGHSVIQITSKEEADWVIVAISDQGIGMTEEEQNQLFKRFFRAKNDTTASTQGTGLGLYLSKFFIEAHHGRLQVASQVNQGSKFSVYLPIRDTQTKSARNGAQRSLSNFRFSTRMKENSYV